MTQKIEVDTKTFVRFWLVLLGLALLGLFLWRAMVGLIIVGVAAFLAIAIHPLAKWIDTADRKKQRPALSAVLAVLIVLSGLTFIFATIGPVVVNETSRFASQMPETFDQVAKNWSGINQLGQAIGIPNLQMQISEWLNGVSSKVLSDLSGTVIASVGTIANLLTGTILVIVLTMFFLLEGPTLLQKLWQILASRDAKKAKVAQRLAEKMAAVIAKYVSGQMSVALLDGAMTVFAVFVIALIFGFSPGLAFPMGLITAVFYMVPMFGAIIGCILVSILLFFSMPIAGLVFAIYYAIYQQIENNLIAPKVQGDALKLPPLIVLIAITIGMYMFGLIGAIIAIPIAGCIKVLIDEYPAIKSLK